MQVTNLIAVRTPDGRLCYASYKDEAERAQILAWAKENKAVVGPAALNDNPDLLRKIA